MPPSQSNGFCQPFFLPVLLVPVWAYLRLQCLDDLAATDLSNCGLCGRAIDRAPPPSSSSSSSRTIQILNLFLGLVIYQDAAKRKISVPLEMLLCWFGGPAGLLVYAIRRPFSKG